MRLYSDRNFRWAARRVSFTSLLNPSLVSGRIQSCLGLERPSDVTAVASNQIRWAPPTAYLLYRRRVSSEGRPAGSPSAPSIGRTTSRVGKTLRGTPDR